jgi:hypothetical protein
MVFNPRTFFLYFSNPFPPFVYLPFAALDFDPSEVVGQSDVMMITTEDARVLVRDAEAFVQDQHISR